MVLSPCITSAEQQENLRHIITTFNGIMSKKAITWWIDYGTLLGAYVNLVGGCVMLALLTGKKVVLTTSLNLIGSQASFAYHVGQ